MVSLTVWWIGHRMANAFYLHPVGKAAGTGLTSFILFPQPVVLQKNCHLLMRSLVLTHPMENRWPLCLFRRRSVTGRDTVVVGRLIFIFSILPTTVHKIFLQMKLQEMNFRCG